MTRRFLSCLLLILVWTAPALAQEALRIEQDKGQIVKLPQAASSVFIANPDIADLQVMSPTMVYLFGKKAGETSLIAVNADEQVLTDRRVVITQNLSGLDRALRERLPNRQIRTSSVDGAIILSGTVASAAEAEDARRIAQRFAGGEQTEVLNRLTVTGSTQVMLRVRVSEVARSIREDLGFNWEVFGNLGAGYALGFASGLTDISSTDGALNRTTGMMNLFGAHRGQRWDINGLIDALASDGLVTVLAEPNLVAASGETASFLAGGEFPVPIPQERDRITLEFKQFGVSLAFTPTVVSGDRISMRVRPEVSELDFSNAIVISDFRVPALRTRRAETTVELGSGQSFAIAGMMQNSLNEGIDKFPFIGDVPVLGTLFRSSRFQRNETELVIIVTPYIVRPTASPEQLSAPTDAFAPTKFVDRVFFGKLTQPGPGPRPAARPTLSGPAGFIVE
ncbi:MAG TPA: type II and III secretion system protein family protein [Azospirillum sp.]|nr:type II and III secretion system protein family protein [Azospirillum sp.]